jgi:hypothetical protein
MIGAFCKKKHKPVDDRKACYYCFRRYQGKACPHLVLKFEGERPRFVRIESRITFGGRR